MPWIGRIPAHWPVLPNRAIFAEVKDKNHADEQMLSVTIARGVIPQKSLLEDSSKKDGSNRNKAAYKLVCPGDIAYNKMRAWQGAIGVSEFRGIISPAYIVERLRDDSYPRYFHWLYRTPYFAKEAERCSYGITSDMWSLRPEHFKMIYSAKPPREEQEAILRFLDFAGKQLDRTIRAKKKLIALLNEQKQAIIERAVIQGFDADVRLKPSGTSWLGKVPRHWDVRRTSWLFDERIERGRAGLPILVVSLRTGVTVGSDLEDDGRPRRLIQDLTSYKYAEQGDIAYNTMRMWQGAVGVVRTAGLVSPAYVVARPRKGVLSGYFELVFRTDRCKGEINRNSRGIVSDRNRLYWDQFKRLYLPLPPFEEQKQIVLQLEQDIAPLNAAIDRFQREIDLIREFRTRMIAAVVTGQLDVREVSRTLPAEVDAPELSVEAVAEDDSEDLLEAVADHE